MLLLCILCLMVSGQVNGNWADGSKDPDHSNLGFDAVNMACNEDKTACGDCYTARSHGLVYLNVFEYTADPYKVQASIEDGIQDWDWTFIQDDPSQLFRFCKEIKVSSTPELPLPMRASLCIDNDFSGIDVPSDCATPVATVTMDTHFADENINGQQTLYCIPSQ
ncbi:uncharacterized protein LOC119733199 [Patiria miniata]|uniref:Uncharacterized protein n=1 Tax=Patiria miniata TaxID=46514 RepID=A0A914AG71_PATMI|nr:uncharacterized protein LOC119733199 [Patiria miniata]